MQGLGARQIHTVQTRQKAAALLLSIHEPILKSPRASPEAGAWGQLEDSRRTARYDSENSINHTTLSPDYSPGKQT